MESGIAGMRPHTAGRDDLVQEYVMFNSNVATYPAVEAGSSSYLDNLWQATLSLFAAVFAVAPAQSESGAVQARAELFRLAGKIESTMPNQAAELRYFAR
jgi:hypothetical protein